MTCNFYILQHAKLPNEVHEFLSLTYFIIIIIKSERHDNVIV